ncbi:Crossover junction endonuclease MUS81 [Rhynchospora pubera]|uniref:Crossover junction endonuclease MUS81 n=1 Tax=Rhynchospora pubera TaxID=906938 RepID=A0AAV8GIH5_9POAL|nr:Crossover junction endonuclease MUS81 [Rhynchospora pubera]
MATPMETARPVRCPANEAVALYLFNKRQEMAAASFNGFSENLDMTLSKAYGNICASKTPIKTLKDLSQIKGVGKWILRLMKGFFPDEASPSTDSLSTSTDVVAPQKGKNPKATRRYVPQKNSVSYALLITLYREMINGKTFMKKQELIDAAEASGLSRTSVGPDKTKGRPGQFGSTPRDWYTGWSCMKTLISKGLVVKSSCPAKYMLTDEGVEAARDCLSRSGLDDLTDKQPINLRIQNDHHGASSSDMDCIPTISHTEPTLVLNQAKSTTKDMQISQIDISDSDSDSDSGSNPHEKAAKTSSATLATSTSYSSPERFNFDLAPTKTSLIPVNTIQDSFNLRGCNTSDSEFSTSKKDLTDGGIINTLAMPPSQPGERFHETYDVILILDERENFGSRFRKVVDAISSQFKVPVEVRRLPVGDGLWIARHKQVKKEYVLDFIVERKNVDDLRGSIRDNRYRDQKLRLQRCGLKKLIYLVEGDPNLIEAADSIKTACFTTEILEGFDVQRTTGFADTVRKYGHLTKSIIEYYSANFSGNSSNFSRRDSMVCPSFGEFVRRCQDLEKMTVTDVFALQLMQVPQVTEEAALAVVEVYPTVLSLVKAYSLLEEDVLAQEEMLKNKCKAVSLSASKNIFKLVWSSS